MHRSPSVQSGPARGFVLIASMVMLVLLSALAISLYHNVAIQEKIAANTKEKARAFQVAQSTLEYAEYLLNNNPAGLPQSSTCTAAPPPQVATVCSNAVILSSTSTPMLITNGTKYTTMRPPLVLSRAGGVGNYFDNPQFYIQNLSGRKLFQVTALAYGGTANAVAVVQSTYQLSSNVKNLGGP